MLTKIIEGWFKLFPVITNYLLIKFEKNIATIKLEGKGIVDRSDNPKEKIRTE